MGRLFTYRTVYVTGTHQGSTRVTYVDVSWTIPKAPAATGGAQAFWIGIGTDDGLNLIQPVSVWLGTGWEVYNEYFQWSPLHNTVFPGWNAKPGDLIFVSVTYKPSTSAYTMYIEDVTTGWFHSDDVAIQLGNNSSPKNYTKVYIVLENSATTSCSQWPASGTMTFTDPIVEYDHVAVTPLWTPGHMHVFCNASATVNTNNNSVVLTWDPHAPYSATAA